MRFSSGDSLYSTRENLLLMLLALLNQNVFSLLQVAGKFQAVQPSVENEDLKWCNTFLEIVSNVNMSRE